MTMDREELSALIIATVHCQVTEASTATEYREPLVGFASAGDPRFADLRHVVHPTHMLPQDLLPGARSVVSFFLPFAPWVVEANSRDRKEVAREWAVAYYETNALIGRMSARLIEILGEQGIGSAAEPATLNFDPQTLISRWSHKSVGVIAGIGSLGVHHMVITDAGCAGRYGSIVLDADLPMTPAQPRERCLYFHDRSCLECVMRCPVGALDADRPIDKQLCWRRCQEVAAGFEDLDQPDICGKCAIGPCSFESAVP